MLYGTDKYRYELVSGEVRIREGWSFFGTSTLAIDSQDRVYLFNRSRHPVLVFDRDGNLLNSWGDGLFKRPHGIYLGPDESVYLSDDLNHTVSKFTLDGKLIMTLGKKTQPSDTGYVMEGTAAPGVITGIDSIKRGGPPFNRPSAIALSSSGEIYVTDGYGNARVHKFTPDGTLLFSWGEPGTAPGQFRLPHFVWVDKQERVWVADRENNRIQIFTPQGEFISQWTDIGRPAGIFIDKDEETVYICESDWRVCVFTIDGKLLSRWDTREDLKRDEVPFGHLHTIVVDSRGDIYVGASGYVKKFARKM